MEQNTSKVFTEVSAPAITTATEVGSALFVINLCASMAPMATAAKTLPGLDKYRVYQVSRAEDGRTRYRLRLGFFTSEADAEQTLASVRDQYPTAFTACLGDEDRKFTRGFLPEHSHAGTAPPAPAPRPQMSVVVDNDSTRPLKALRQAVTPPVTPPVVVTAAAPATPAMVAKPATSSVVPVKPVPVKPAAVESAVIEIDWEPSTPAAPTPASTARTEKTPAAKAKSAPAPLGDAVEIEMTWEPPATTVTPASAPPAATRPVAKPEVKIEKSVPVTPATSPVAQTVTQARAPAVAAPAEPTIEQVAAPAAAVSAAKVEPVNTDAARLVPKAAIPAKPAVAATIAQPAKPVVPAPKPASSATAPLSPAATVPASTLELVTTSTPLPPPAAAAHRGVVEAKAPALDSIQLTLDAEVAAQPAAIKPSAATSQPFHVGKGVELPATSLTLDSDGAAKPSAAAHEPVPATSVAAPSTSLSYDHLDSTQTIRALTEQELNDESTEKCFAIQLVVSEQPVNLDAMPHLDIFEAYRLYSIATAGSGKITHSLRIGFFREAVSAEAVSGYLRTFFPSPTIVRISLAEQARFKDPPQPKSEPIAASNETDGKVVALSDARARNARPAIPTVTMEVVTPAHVDAGATGSFKPNATGSFKPNATGSFKSSATGTHKAVKSAAKASATPTRRSAPLAANKKSATGKHPALPKKALSQQLIDEAHATALSESGIAKKGGSLLSRLVGKLSK